MKEGPSLDLGLVRRAHQRQALVGRHLHAGHPHHGFVFVGQGRRKAHAGDAFERLVVELGDAGIALQHFVDAPQLRLADRRLQVGDAIIVAHPLVPVGAVRRHAVVAQHAQRLREVLRIGEAHAAFACGDDLVGIEGEAGDVAELPDCAAAIARTVGFGAILDHRDAAAPGELGDRADLGRPSIEMDGNDRLGLCRAGVLDRFQRHAPGLAVDIDDYRRGAAIEHRVDGRRESEIRHDHFIARTDPKSDKRQVQGDGAVRHGNAVPDPDEAAELLLEFLDVGAPARDPAGDEGVQQRAELMAGHVGHRDLHGLDRSIDQDAGQIAAGIDHRLEHSVVNHVVAQPLRRGPAIGQVPFQGRVDHRGAVDQASPYVIERNAADQALVILDDKASTQPIVEAFLDDRQDAFRLVANECSWK